MSSPARHCALAACLPKLTCDRTLNMLHAPRNRGHMYSTAALQRSVREGAQQSPGLKLESSLGRTWSLSLIFAPVWRLLQALTCVCQAYIGRRKQACSLQSWHRFNRWCAVCLSTGGSGFAPFALTSLDAKAVPCPASRVGFPFD